MKNLYVIFYNVFIMIKRYQAKTKFINKYGLEKFLTFSNVVCDHQHDIIAARYPFKSFKKEVVA